MKSLSRASLVFISSLLFASVAYADGSLSITSLTPSSGQVTPNSLVQFTIVPSGFDGPIYQLADSFGGSSASVSNIGLSNSFYWVPSVSDVGTHTLTISASDHNGTRASVTQTIVVLPAPSVSVSSLSPGSQVQPGSALTFKASASGFTNPTYSLGDAFSGGTINLATIDSNGNVSWTPAVSDNGQHTITVYASDSLGHHAQVNVPVLVGAGPTLTIQLLSPGPSVRPGQAVSFGVSPSGFSPTSFGVSDSMANSTVTNSNISVSGQFNWTPSPTDVGVHILTILGSVGVYGDKATVAQTITVLNADGTQPAGAATPATTTTSTTATAASSTNTTANALQAQLATLQAQLATLSGASAAPTSSGGSYTFTLSLKQGSHGDEVSALQRVLAHLGFFSGDVTGYFGPATASAVRAFQAAHGLDQLGIVGPSTRAALNGVPSGTTSAAPSPAPSPAPSTSSSYNSDSYTFQNFIGPGDTGTDVIELQIRLAKLGYLSQWPSGTYGSATEAAVKAFQSAKGIAAKGYVGPSTRDALNQ